MSAELKIRSVKLTSIYTICAISSQNPMFDHLLELSWWDDSNKWSNIGFGEEICTYIEIKICYLSGAWPIYMSVHRAPDKVCLFISLCLFFLQNPMFDHLLESSHRDDSNKWSSIGIGQEIKLASIEIHFTHLFWRSGTVWWL